MIKKIIEDVFCDYESYQKKIDKKEDEIDNKEDELRFLSDELLETREKKEAAEKALKKALKTKEPFKVKDMKEWYYDKYGQKNNWYYNAKSKGGVEVSSVLKNNDDTVLIKAADEIIKKYRLTKNSKPETVVANVIRYFMLSKNWDYKTDIELYGRPEYWQSASHSWDIRKGDCDDLAILMHNLVYFMFKKLGMVNEHYWRLKYTAMGTITEAHAFNIWMGEDGEWYVVESTLDLRNNFIKTWLKTPLKNNNLYSGKPWGFADRYNSWKGSIVSMIPYENDGKM